MAARRTRRIASVLVAAALGGAGVAARAQDWTITPQFSDQEEFTDNLFYTPDHTRSDLITTLAPGINISGESRRLQGTLFYSPSIYLYALTPSQDLVGQNMYANGTAEIVPDTLFFDARAFMGLMPSTPGLTNGALGPNVGPPSVGIPGIGVGVGTTPFAVSGIPRARTTQTMSFTASPYLAHRFGDIGSAELRYTLTDANFSGGTNIRGTPLPNSTATTNEATAAFLTGDRFGPFVARLLLDDAQSSGTGIAVNSSQQLEIVDSAYALTRRVSLLASLGHENIIFNGIPPLHIDDIVWGAGLQLTPAAGTTIDLSYGRRNGVTGPYVSAIYSLSGMTTLTATYSTGITTTAQEIANTLAVSGINSAGQLVDTRTLLPTAILNPTTGVQAGVFEVKQLIGTASFDLQRNHLTASVNRSENRLLSQSRAGLGNSQSSIGGTFQWQRELTPLATANLTIGYTRYSFPSLGATEDEGLLTAGVSVSYALSASLNAWAGYNRIDRSSPDPLLRVNADMIFAGMSKAF